MAGRSRSDAARQPGAAGANPAVFFRRSRFSICAPGLCAGNCSEARFWVRFCVQKSRPLVRGLPGARFYYVDHFRKKAACGGSLFLKKILHARSLPVGQSCCSVAIWGAQGLEKCRCSDTKIGAARRPQFWGRSSSLFMYLHIIIREAGCISWPHFWGRETAPFFGVASLSPGLTQLGLVSVPAPALVPGTLGSSVQNISLGIRGLSEAAACFCNGAAERELQLWRPLSCGCLLACV